MRGHRPVLNGAVAMIDWAPKPVTVSHLREILDYFGKCPSCGYPARAAELIMIHSDGSVSATATGTCELPCGWSGPVAITTMTARM
ncbi:hypothetical protein BOX37_24970 [Nocardia mangyaensis]|uniref:Uncharacterized protein n=2 Tax=Nocardia mangyaensis TaxID=2213200 RepID=A0A1J0VXA7_9NOCA|nr:hypothetical protein BOX37_24970 [Nocardia mangyaensis]